MEIIRFDYRHAPQIERGASICLGSFDGMHRGHQRLFFEAKYNAKNLAAILLFSKPIYSLLHPEKEASVLTSLEDQLRLANGYGIDVAYVCEIDEGFVHLSKEDFMKRVLDPLHPEGIYVGADFRFGENRSGTIEDLKNAYPTHVIPFVEEDGKKIASSSIRDFIREGDMEKTGKHLGRPYEIKGHVGHGKQIGTTLGYPTLNLILDASYLLPKHGVYAAIVYLHGVPYKAALNIGLNPTIGGLTAPSIEAFLLGYSGLDAYGKTAYIQLVSYLREEKKFPNLEALSEQIKKDVDEVEKALSNTR